MSGLHGARPTSHDYLPAYVHAMREAARGCSTSVYGPAKTLLERVHWAVIQEENEYEPRQVGSEVRTDFGAHIQRWIEGGGTLA